MLPGPASLYEALAGRAWKITDMMQSGDWRMFMLRVKTLSTPDYHWRNPRKQNDRERSNIKARVSVHWLAQCHAKWLRSGRNFQHQAGIEPHVASLTATRLNHWAIDSLMKKMVHESSSLATWNCLFVCRIVVLGFLRLNINARHDIPDFLNATLWSIHLIACELTWFPPWIDRIFPSSTSKQYLKG